MGVYEGRGQITKIMKELMSRWIETRASWEDSVSKAFEEKHLAPLEQHVKTALGAMDHMSVLLQQARRDCE